MDTAFSDTIKATNRGAGAMLETSPGAALDWRVEMPNKSKPILLSEKDIERFWSKVDRSGGADSCWPWTGSVSRGYGQFGAFWDDRWHNIKSHRVAHVLTNGQMEPTLFVCHHCDNRCCCNPAHLFAGTPADNIHDALRKQRLATGDRAGSHLHPESRARGARHGQSKLTDDDVRAIRAALRDGGSHRGIARQFGVSHRVIYDIAHRAYWTHVEDEESAA